MQSRNVHVRGFGTSVKDMCQVQRIIERHIREPDSHAAPGPQIRLEPNSEVFFLSITYGNSNY